jgi:hypothetical protein
MSAFTSSPAFLSVASLSLISLKVLLRPEAGFGGVTDQTERAELRLDVAKAELHGVVPVAIDGLHLRHRARAGFHDGDGHNRALVVVDAGHADFAT